MQRLQDALSPDLCAEFFLCEKLDLQLKFEKLGTASAAAIKDGRKADVITLMKQRTALGYTHPGISAADMRARLISLKLLLDGRFVVLAEADDCLSCEV